MNDSTHTMTRYLLGALSEAEQTALEEEYFGDPRVVDEVAKVESALVDDYVRGRLAPEARRRFEQVYLSDPRRRDRVKFAEALATRLDQASAAGAVSRGESLAAGSRWRAGWGRFVEGVGGPRPALGFALASLLILSAGMWWVIDSRRSVQESRQAEAAPTDQERRDRESQSAAERARAGQRAAGPAPGNPTTAPATPAQKERPSPGFVTLALAVGPGVRGADTSPSVTLVIPPGTEEVRVALDLREHDYPRYRVLLHAVGGTEILRRSDLRPIVTTSTATFSLTIPANRFDAGEYILTLQGATGGGEHEDLSQSLFRVERR